MVSISVPRRYLGWVNRWRVMQAQAGMTAIVGDEAYQYRIKTRESGGSSEQEVFVRRPLCVGS